MSHTLCCSPSLVSSSSCLLLSSSFLRLWVGFFFLYCIICYFPIQFTRITSALRSGEEHCVCVRVCVCVFVCVCIRLFITLKDWMDSPESPQKTTKALGLECFVLLYPAASASASFSFPSFFHCCFSPPSCCCCCCCVCGKLSLASPIMVHSHVNRNAFQFI